MKRQQPEPVTTVTDETIIIPKGEVTYWIKANDDEIEKLAAGRVPLRIMDCAYRSLSWKREAAQQWDDYQPVTKAV